MQGNFG